MLPVYLVVHDGQPVYYNFLYVYTSYDMSFTWMSIYTAYYIQQTLNSDVPVFHGLAKPKIYPICPNEALASIMTTSVKLIFHKTLFSQLIVFNAIFIDTLLYATLHSAC